MIQEVKGCKDCPMANFSEWNYSSCENPQKPSNCYLPDNYFRDVADGVSPDWCPLKKEDLTIKLIEP